MAGNFIQGAMQNALSIQADPTRAMGVAQSAFASSGNLALKLTALIDAEEKQTHDALIQDQQMTLNNRVQDDLVDWRGVQDENTDIAQTETTKHNRATELNATNKTLETGRHDLATEEDSDKMRAITSTYYKNIDENAKKNITLKTTKAVKDDFKDRITLLNNMDNALDQSKPGIMTIDGKSTTQADAWTEKKNVISTQMNDLMYKMDNLQLNKDGTVSGVDTNKVVKEATSVPTPTLPTNSQTPASNSTQQVVDQNGVPADGNMQQDNQYKPNNVVDMIAKSTGVTPDNAAISFHGTDNREVVNGNDQFKTITGKNEKIARFIENTYGVQPTNNKSIRAFGNRLAKTQPIEILDNAEMFDPWIVDEAKRNAAANLVTDGYRGELKNLQTAAKLIRTGKVDKKNFLETVNSMGKKDNLGIDLVTRINTINKAVGRAKQNEGNTNILYQEVYDKEVAPRFDSSTLKDAHNVLQQMGVIEGGIENVFANSMGTSTGAKQMEPILGRVAQENSVVHGDPMVDKIGDGFNEAKNWNFGSDVSDSGLVIDSLKKLGFEVNGENLNNLLGFKDAVDILEDLNYKHVPTQEEIDTRKVDIDTAIKQRKNSYVADGKDSDIATLKQRSKDLDKLAGYIEKTDSFGKSFEDIKSTLFDNISIDAIKERIIIRNTGRAKYDAPSRIILAVITMKEMANNGTPQKISGKYMDKGAKLVGKAYDGVTDLFTGGK